MLCLNCGEPAGTVIQHSVSGKPSDVVTCLVIGLFFIFGVPALLFGSYLLLVGGGFLGTPSRLKDNGMITIGVSVIPLGVFIALFVILVKVWASNRAAR